MVIVKTLAVVIIAFLSSPLVGCPISESTAKSKMEDSPQNRKELAERYFELVPVRQVFKDMGDEMATRMPADVKEQFLAYWKTFVETEDLIREFEVAGIESMAKHMTTSELQVFVEFMEKPEGQSAMQKMKYYMADIMPLVQKLSTMSIQKFQANRK